MCIRVFCVCIYVCLHVHLVCVFGGACVAGGAGGGRGKEGSGVQGDLHTSP